MGHTYRCYGINILLSWLGHRSKSFPAAPYLHELIFSSLKHMECLRPGTLNLIPNTIVNLPTKLIDI